MQCIVPEIKEYEYGNRQRSQRYGVAPFVDHVHLIPQLEKKKKKCEIKTVLCSRRQSPPTVYKAIDVLTRTHANKKHFT